MSGRNSANRRPSAARIAPGEVALQATTNAGDPINSSHESTPAPRRSRPRPPRLLPASCLCVASHGCPAHRKSVGSALHSWHDATVVMSPSTEVKRRQLEDFVERRLRQHDAVRAVIAVGSVGAGTAHEGSDIDVAVFLEPYDSYLVPAEAIWCSSTDTFHSIFTKDAEIQRDGIQLDFQRHDLQRWRAPEHPWPGPVRAELAAGWTAFDRDGEVSGLIADHAAYSEEHRLTQLDEAITWLDQHLDEGDIVQRWETLGPVVAHDRLQAAYDYLVQGLFAANRRWRIWRNREMTALLDLAWLPPGFEYAVLDAAIGSGHSRAAYLARAATLRELFGQLLTHLRADGTYGPDPVSEAFIRSHAEPGRAWNLDQWINENLARHAHPMDD